MTTNLSITTVFADGRVEHTGHDWPGWDLKAAASMKREQHWAERGGLVYDLLLCGRHREAGIVRVVHMWSDSGRAVDDAPVTAS